MMVRVLGGQVEVRAPLRTSQRRIREFVQAKRQWVLDKLVEHRERVRPAPFGHGDTVPYMGRDTSIWVEPGPVDAIEVSLHGEDCEAPDTDPGFIYMGFKHLHVSVPSGMEDVSRRDGIRMALVSWYRAKAEEVLQETVDEWKPRVAPRAKPVVRISNARSQWGSCSSDGVLRFSWRCLLLNEWQIEYIAVHELAHLKVRNHSKAFWRVVTKAISDAVFVRRSITQAAKTLPW